MAWSVFILKEACMVGYNTQHKLVLDALFLAHPQVRSGKMFGYYVGRKLCASLYEQGIGIKLPVETASRLLETDPNVVPFMPLGRPKMRQWVQINLERSEDFAHYLPVFEESIRYVQSLQDKTAE
jgi:hypothetical protein